MACRILLVEDNPASLELMRYLLHSGGYQVLLAGNGQEALDQLSHTLPDLVLTDIQMPVLDGYELLSHIRASARTRGSWGEGPRRVTWVACGAAWLAASKRLA